MLFPIAQVERGPAAKGGEVTQVQGIRGPSLPLLIGKALSPQRESYLVVDRALENLAHGVLEKKADLPLQMLRLRMGIPEHVHRPGIRPE